MCVSGRHGPVWVLFLSSAQKLGGGTRIGRNLKVGEEQLNVGLWRQGAREGMEDRR